MGPFEGGQSAICIRDCIEGPKSKPSWKVEGDASLLTLLNRVVRAHDRAIWVYSENHCGKAKAFKIEAIAE